LSDVRPLVVTMLGLLLAVPAAADSRQAAVERAAAWLAAFPPEHLRFDAAVMLHGIRTHVDSAVLREAWERARVVADRDDDHPLRRLWMPSLTTPPSFTSGWPIPDPGAPRANTERLLIEAAHCDRNGLRRAATRYACTAMRDEGGFYTTHALWGLVLARARGCERPEKLRRCIAHLGAELRVAQPRVLRPARTLDVDLFAERTLMSCLAGMPRGVAHDLDLLLAAQRRDGSWGVADPDEAPYHRFHATAIATWALVACP
jgi:hypothetical protein